MEKYIFNNAQEVGEKAGTLCAKALNNAIEERGFVRFLIATGASQFETLECLKKQKVDWEKVELFHLDEYVGIGESHPASFVGYLKKRFTDHLPIKKIHFIDGMADTKETIARITSEIRKAPIDVAFIGIGENGHIAFNDPPADFDTKEAYAVVVLDEKCKKQQVGEGWFESIDTVPKQAISMTVYQIMQCKLILSAVPHTAKAKAVKDTLEQEVNNMVPATILKNHKNWVLCLDKNSASLLS